MAAGRAGGILTRQSLNVGRRNSGPLRDLLRRVFGQALLQFVEAVGIAGDVVGIVQAVAQDNVHQAHGQRYVGTGIDGDVPVGNPRGAGAVGINDHQLGAVAARLFDKRPQVNVVAVDVGAPGNDVLGVAKLLGLGADFSAVNGDDGVSTGGGANRPQQLRGSQSVEEAHVHRAAVEDAKIASVGVRQHRLGAELGADVFQPRRNLRESVVPGNALEGRRAASSLRSYPAHGVKHAVRRVNTVKVLRNLGTQEALRNGMCGIALDAGSASILHRYEGPAGVGTIVRAGGMDNLFHRKDRGRLSHVTRRSSAKSNLTRGHRDRSGFGAGQASRTGKITGNIWGFRPQN